MSDKKLAEELFKFLRWIERGGVDDIFDIINTPETVVYKYIEEKNEHL